MKKIIHNDDNVKENEITDEVVRVKALIIKDNKLLIANENNVFHFPGGHVEDNEKLLAALIREIKEETGIIFEYKDFNSPFMKVEFLNRDYPKKGINRKNTIYYYAVDTDRDIDLNNVNYTENEKLNNFKIELFDLKESPKIIEDNIKNDPMNKVIAPDMIMAINEYLYGEKEVIDIYDKYGNPTGKIVKRGGPKFYLNEGEYIGIAIIFIENSNGEFLIQKASREKNNKISSTGGHIDRGENPIDTIIRETKEEIGLDITKEEIESYEKTIYKNRLVYTYYVKKDVDLSSLILQKDEVESVKYMSRGEIEELIDNDNFSETHSFVYNKFIRR